MATQGLVTVCKNGVVIMKFVAGSNGYNAKKLAALIRANGLPASLVDAQAWALQEHFGSEDTLVVMNADAVRYRDEESYDLPEPRSLYRETFTQPRHNPRWSEGTADHVIVIDL